MAVEVLIIGAGPAGALAAALLCRQGLSVLVLEREQFPRFSIGESLLPQSMEYLDQAGMLGAVAQANFQIKNGAAFGRGDDYSEFDFRDKFTDGWSYTYQVPRARFDHLLALEAQRQGAEVRFRQEVVAADFRGARPRLTIMDRQSQEKSTLEAGFGRVLPRLLDLERPSDFPVRGAIFTHVEDHIAPTAFDRNKIRINVQPNNGDLWYWLIPFSDGRSSIGVVGNMSALAKSRGEEIDRLRALIAADRATDRLLEQARWDTPVRQIVGYASNVKALCDRGYALLGNAGEFLDPIFSSGVTIAFKSASLAAALIPRQLAGVAVDWIEEFAVPLKRGVDTFRAFVESWYRGGFQRIIFHPRQPTDIRRMIAAVLAGYAWDEKNPYVSQTRRRLAALEELC
jgi:flavin-dependent dehydrogenase